MTAAADDDLVRQKKEHMKMRNFMKKQRMRERYDAEKAALQNQVDALSASLTSLSSPGAAAARALLKQLRADCRSARELSQTMTAWVTSMCNRGLPHAGTPFGWTQTSLLADPTARKLGLDWFSQHLYHNTERMLAYAQIPSAGTFADNHFLDVGDGYCDVIGRVQVEYTLSLPTLHAALRPHVWSRFRGANSRFFSEVLDEELTTAISPGNMLYRRTVCDATEAHYYVCREFPSQEDRIVFLLGTFAHDEQLPACRLWRPRMFWYVLERTSPTTSRLRILLFNGPYQECGHVLSMRDLLTMEYAIETSAMPDDGISPTYRDAVQKEVAPMLLDYLETLRSAPYQPCN